MKYMISVSDSTSITFLNVLIILVSGLKRFSKMNSKIDFFLRSVSLAYPYSTRSQPIVLLSCQPISIVICIGPVWVRHRL